MNIGNKIKRLRIERGLTQQQLSGDKITRNMLSCIESGKALPSMASFFYICEFLGITPAEFFSVEQSYPERVREINEHLRQLDDGDLNAVLYLTGRLSGDPNRR